MSETSAVETLEAIVSAFCKAAGEPIPQDAIFIVRRLRADNERLREAMGDASRYLIRLERDLSSLYWNADGEGPEEPPEHLTESIEAAQNALGGTQT